MARRGKQKKGKKKRGQPTSVMERLRDLAFGFLFGSPVDEGTRDRLQEIKGLCLMAFSAWLLISMLSFYAPHGDPGAEGRNWGGQLGFFLANGALRIAGWGAYLAAVLGLAWGFVILARKQIAWPSMRLFGAVCLVLSVSFMLQLGFGPATDAGGPAGASSPVPFGPGGWLAFELVETHLVPKFGVAGLWIMLSMLSLVSFMLATEMAFWPAIVAAGEWLEERRADSNEGRLRAGLRWFGGILGGLWDFLRGADLCEDDSVGTAPAKQPKASVQAVLPGGDWEEEEEQPEEEEEWEDEEYTYEDEDEEDDDEYEYEDEEEEEDEEEQEEELEEEAVIEPVKPKRPKKPVKTSGAARADKLKYETPSPPKGPWQFPPLDLLENPMAGVGVEDATLQKMASKLEHALKSFRVDAEVVSAQVGPAVTMFELTVEQGTRMNKVTALSQEIAAALQAKSVRIIAPIPGRSTIGVEVPNKARRTVRLRELINKKAYDAKHAALPLFLGMDSEGKPVVENLASMPHLLIAGTTGSGKSVCINTILASLLLTRSPHDVQMVLVDPKMVELMTYAKVPHLMLPVVTDARKATAVLEWLCEKMEGRYELMKDARVRNIRSYNDLGEEGLRERLGDNFNEDRTPRHLSYIVVVIDEMADLMLVSKKEAESAIVRLAQKARAVGIHVIVATQRPSTDVITGVLKGNLPTRIAFRVASKIDSRVILDHGGAEKLLGGGDMLFTPPGSSQLNRVQGAFLEDDELQKIVDFVCDASAPTFDQELVQTATGSGKRSSSDGPDDPLWNEAVRIVLESKRGSASLLQRALAVGYTRASRLIDLMTEEGILGDHRGSKSREIMISLKDWDAAHEDPLNLTTSDE
ncbi:MAG: DNA translocase FtsK [bacterium]|nr:DNA translocase FtsK [Planctomycetota bacterium]HIL52551.1 DNA translocase FtsK [Planctomycetota bacterium]